jgi:hypothetical protein
MAAVKAVGAGIMTAFGPGSGIFTIISSQFDILSAKFQIAMLKGVQAIATALTGMFDTPLMDAARKINPLLDSQLKAIEGISKAFEGNIKSLDKNVSDSQNKISNAAGQIAGDFKLAGEEMGKAYDKALNSSKDLINTSEMQVKLKQYQNELDKIEAEARSNAAKKAAEKLTVEEMSVKIAQDRLTHEERLKELDADIASAKRQGNKAELKELEAMKAFHIELEASKQKGLSLDQAMTNANKAKQAVIDGVVNANKDELTIKKQITKELEKQLGLGQKIIADANAAQRKDRLDPGGRLEKQAGAAIGEGNFAEARRIGRQLRGREFDRSFKEAFGGGDVTEIAKKEGIDTFRKTQDQLKKELMEKRQQEMKPGAEGKKGDKPGEAAKPPEKAENLLQKAVDAIKTAVESLEKKLPTPALGA